MAVRVAINGFGRIGRNVLRGPSMRPNATISKWSPSNDSARSRPNAISCATIQCTAAFPAP